MNWGKLRFLLAAFLLAACSNTTGGSATPIQSTAETSATAGIPATGSPAAELPATKLPYPVPSVTGLPATGLSTATVSSAQPAPTNVLLSTQTQAQPTGALSTAAASLTSTPQVTSTVMLPLILTPKAPATPSVDQLPDPSTAQFKLFTGGLTHPVQVSGVPDGSGRVFILEKAGLIRIVKNGQLLDTPFLDIRDRVGSQNTEQGLLGLAFHPDFPKQNFFYLNYTNPSGNSVVSSFQVSSNPDQADPNSETILFTVDQPYANHNGGSMEIGPEGYLYIGFGDGGSEGDPLDNGQSLQTHLGKILRIDISGGNSYTIPPDNPFVNGGGLPEIWEYGLRNPWRFSFDMQTGDMYIADVGQNKWEEVDYVPAKTQGGLNFGWSYYEGDHPYKGTPPQNETFVFPVHEYSHSEGCSISGGSVYRGQDLPDWQGVYLYGDYCLGKVWGLLRHSNGAWENKLMYQMNANITHVGTDAQGEIYLADYQGSVYRLEKP